MSLQLAANRKEVIAALGESERGQGKLVHLLAALCPLPSTYLDRQGCSVPLALAVHVYDNFMHCNDVLGLPPFLSATVDREEDYSNLLQIVLASSQPHTKSQNWPKRGRSFPIFTHEPLERVRADKERHHSPCLRHTPRVSIRQVIPPRTLILQHVILGQLSIALNMLHTNPSY